MCWTRVRGRGLDGPASGALTQQHGRDAPAQGVVEAHGAAVHVARLHPHAVEVQRLHQEPREGAEEEVVQEDGDRGAQQLRAGQGRARQGLSCLPRLRRPASAICCPPLSPKPQQLTPHPAPNPGPDQSSPDPWP